MDGPQGAVRREVNEVCVLWVGQESERKRSVKDNAQFHCEQLGGWWCQILLM